MTRRLGLLGAVAVALLVGACSSDDPTPDPGINGPAVVDTSVDISPSDSSDTVVPPTDAPAPTEPGTTDGLIDSIDGPVSVDTAVLAGTVTP